MSDPIPLAKFRLGRIVMSHNAMNSLNEHDIFTAIQRHQSGDWGDVDQDDRAANDRALIEGTRLLSLYQTSSGVTFWLLTEADRSFTTVLLPEDY